MTKEKSKLTLEIADELIYKVFQSLCNNSPRGKNDEAIDKLLVIQREIMLVKDMI